MRLVVAFFVALGIVLGAAVFVPRILQPAPAAERLAGVTVSIVRFEVVEEFDARLIVVDVEIASRSAGLLLPDLLVLAALTPVRNGVGASRVPLCG